MKKARSQSDVSEHHEEVEQLDVVVGTDLDLEEESLVDEIPEELLEPIRTHYQASGANPVPFRDMTVEDAKRGRHDSVTGRYIHDVIVNPVMSKEEGYKRAQEIEQAEIALWVSILSHRSAAKYVLEALESDIAKSGEEIERPEIAELLRLATQAVDLSDAGQKTWIDLSTSLATKIRLPDSDREWVAHARDLIAGLVTAPDFENDASDAEQRAGSALPPSAEYNRYLARVERRYSIQHQAKSDFVKANLRLVISIARRYNRGRLPFIDLIQEGNIGLMKGVERFDYRRGYAFSTYASWWIRHAISRALADKGRAIRIPVHMLDTYNRVNRATQAFLSRTGDEPTVEQLEKESGVPRDKIEKVMNFYADTPFSLDRPIGDEDGRKFVDFLVDENAQSPCGILEAVQWHDALKRYIAMLTPIESSIIRWRFGLDDGEELTLKEIGDKYNLSRERIRQLQEQALGKLRRFVRDTDWSP